LAFGQGRCRDEHASPRFKGAAEVAALPGDSLASLIHRASDVTGVFTGPPDDLRYPDRVAVLSMPGIGA